MSDLAFDQQANGLALADGRANLIALNARAGVALAVEDHGAFRGRLAIVRQVLVAVDVGDPRDAVNAVPVVAGGWWTSSAICVAPAPWVGQRRHRGNRHQLAVLASPLFTSACHQTPRPCNRLHSGAVPSTSPKRPAGAGDANRRCMVSSRETPRPVLGRLFISKIKGLSSNSTNASGSPDSITHCNRLHRRYHCRRTVA